MHSFFKLLDAGPHFDFGDYKKLGRVIDEKGLFASDTTGGVKENTTSLLVWAFIIFVVVLIISIVYFRSIILKAKIDPSFFKKSGQKAETAMIAVIDIFALFLVVFAICTTLINKVEESEEDTSLKTTEGTFNYACELAYDHDVTIAYIDEGIFSSNCHVYTYDISDDVLCDAETKAVITDRASVFSERDKLVVFFGKYPQDSVTFEERTKLQDVEWDADDTCYLDGKKYKRTLNSDTDPESSYSYFLISPIPWLFVDQWEYLDTHEKSYDDVLISYCALDNQTFHNMDTTDLPFYKSLNNEFDWEKYSDRDVEWKNCSLREWLNNDFYNTAFSKDEQQMIIPTNNKNYCLSITNIRGKRGDEEDSFSGFGYQKLKDTVDNIFLLSGEEFLEPGKEFIDSKLNNRVLYYKVTQYCSHRSEVNRESYLKKFNSKDEYLKYCNYCSVATRSKAEYYSSHYVVVGCTNFFNILNVDFSETKRSYICEYGRIRPCLRLKLFS